MSELQVINTPKELKTALATPLPEYIHKQKPAGNTKLTYVSGQAVIDKLNATFGYAGWSWDIVERFIQQSEPKVIKIKYENGRKVNLETPIIEPQPPVAHVVGKLTVHLQDKEGRFYQVSKTAPGAQCLVGGQSEQENIFKGANTDALKKAATMFGIGLELYRDENEAYFFSLINYEDPWTEEALEEHKEDFIYLDEFKKKYGLVESDMDNYVNSFSNGTLTTTNYLMPDNISEFVNYLKGLVSAQEQSQGA
jgi:hypothetical protein|nr:MAG TPA: Rad52/22 family double-strand break repair protein [Caudoviricetes sp.]